VSLINNANPTLASHTENVKNVKIKEEVKEKYLLMKIKIIKLDNIKNSKINKIKRKLLALLNNFNNITKIKIVKHSLLIELIKLSVIKRKKMKIKVKFKIFLQLRL